MNRSGSSCCVDGRTGKDERKDRSLVQLRNHSLEQRFRNRSLELHRNRHSLVLSYNNHDRTGQRLHSTERTLDQQ